MIQQSNGLQANKLRAFVSPLLTLRRGSRCTAMVYG
jgi:hypothetical protein